MTATIANRPAQRFTRGVAWLIVAMAAVPASADGPRRAERRHADSTQGPRVESSVVLDPVSSLDFQTAVPVRSSSKSTDDARYVGHSLVVTRSEPGQQRFAAPEVRREVYGLWQLELATSDDMQDLRVEYDVVAPDGTDGRFSHVDNPGSHIAVRAIPLPPRVVERRRGRVLVEGGAALELNLLSASEAGDYRGTIRVNVTHL